VTRLISFLNEKNNEQVFDLIKKDCAPYFKRFKKERLILYSGRKKTEDWYKGQIRQDRRPLDIPEEIHDLTNKYFKKKFGAPLRSECIFAYGLVHYTSSYGKPYIILPIGDFNIYWHPTIIDFYGELDDLISNKWFLQLSDLKMRELNYAMQEKLVKYIDSQLENIVNKYVKNKAPESRLEVMIQGKEYYALSNKWVNTNKYMSRIWEMFNEA
jgi:hypothetical protein